MIKQVNTWVNKHSGLKYYNAIVQTPFNAIGLCFQQHKLIALDFLQYAEEKSSTDPVVQSACQQIEQYCNADSTFKTFDIELGVSGTEFQHRVLRALQQIPYGCTQTYGEVAKKLNTSARAVGGACRSNPLPLVIPCHRVVAADGAGGYCGTRSGRLMQVKHWLLKHESRLNGY